MVVEVLVQVLLELKRRSFLSYQYHVLEKEGDKFVLNSNHPQSIGRVKGYYGNFGIKVRAYAYIRTMGPVGLREVSEGAVLHANYLFKKLEPYFDATIQTTL